jgi:acyl-CoA oxidase
MKKELLVFKEYSPGLLALMPLVYVAWSDRVLSPSEVRLLNQKAKDLNFLKEEDFPILKSWMNPRQPPSRQLFLSWERALISAAQLLPKDSRKSLVDLGLEMANNSAQIKEVENWDRAAIGNHLEQLESAIRSVNWDTYQRIFSKPNQKETSSKAFEIDKMTRLLDGPAYEIRKKVVRFFQDPVFHYRPLRSKASYRKQVLEWCQLMANQGYGAWAFPKEYGGAGDMSGYISIFEASAYFDLSLSIKFGVQFGLFGGSVFWLGTKKHHDKYIKAIGNLDLPGCFAMTETGHGSNVRGLETTAIYDAATKEIIINTPNYEAGKEYIGNALHSRMASVFAQLIVNGENHGVHAILAPLRDENHKLLPGIKVEDNGYKLGLNGVDNGRIWFDNIRVPCENLLDRYGAIDENGNYSSPIANPAKRFFTMLGTLVGGRVSVPKAGLSAAKTGLTIAIKYGLKRRQFGENFSTPETLLLDYPSHQRRLMPLLAKTYAINFALNYLAERYVNRSEEDIREIETLAAGMKSYATWFTTATLQECREACGGKGYLAENRFAALKADSDIFTTFEGDNTVLMQLVAKGVLTTFNEYFHSEGKIGLLRFIGGRVSAAIAEKNPYTIRNTDRDHLLDAEFHLAAFKYRQNHLTYSVGQRMRGLIKGGMKTYDAFLRCQTHLLALANAFVEVKVLECFIKVVEEATDKDLKNSLKNLCDLYALHCIESHKGWYLEVDYMEGVKTKAIRKLVNELCAIIRKDAAALVDAFAIPDDLLHAPIAIETKK